MSYANNFGEPGGGAGGVEGTRAGVQAHIVNTSLRRLVTRLLNNGQNGDKWSNLSNWSQIVKMVKNCQNGDMWLNGHQVGHKWSKW